MDDVRKNPRWWESMTPAPRALESDICSYCGHVRFLHDAPGCTARATSLWNNAPCTCTNIPTGSLFKAGGLQRTEGP